MTVRILQGDCRDVLRTLPDESVHCIVTSPPYFGLRDYGTAKWDGGDPACDHSPEKRGGRFASPVSGKQASNAGSGTASQRDCPCGARRIDSQIGLEQTPDAYVAELVGVFRECRRVLRKDGVFFLNLGDSYFNAAGKASGGGCSPKSTLTGGGGQYRSGSKNEAMFDAGASAQRAAACDTSTTSRHGQIKPKDLIGIPWSVAFALRADGWYLRSDIIWSKPNPMPESVTDRPTKAHEYLFLLSKSERYFYDADAIAELAASSDRPQPTAEQKVVSPNHTSWLDNRYAKGASGYGVGSDGKRNRRSVWTVATQPFSEAHFATFPPDLIEPCIKAGTSEKGCCAKCGAPWKRVVERTAMAIDRSERTHEKGQTRASGTMVSPASSVTTGWSPSCSCNAAVVPCTVLDCFGGAGTTALVADRLQRNSIIIELNPEYAAMSRSRIEKDAGMFAVTEAA